MLWLELRASCALSKCYIKLHPQTPCFHFSLSKIVHREMQFLRNYQNILHNGYLYIFYSSRWELVLSSFLPTFAIVGSLNLCNLVCVWWHTVIFICIFLLLNILSSFSFWSFVSPFDEIAFKKFLLQIGSLLSFKTSLYDCTVLFLNVVKFEILIKPSYQFLMHMQKLCLLAGCKDFSSIFSFKAFGSVCTVLRCEPTFTCSVC